MTRASVRRLGLHWRGTFPGKGGELPDYEERTPRSLLRRLTISSHDFGDDDEFNSRSPSMSDEEEWSLQ